MPSCYEQYVKSNKIRQKFEQVFISVLELFFLIEVKIQSNRILLLLESVRLLCVLGSNVDNDALFFRQEVRIEFHPLAGYNDLVFILDNFLFDGIIKGCPKTNLLVYRFAT